MFCMIVNFVSRCAVGKRGDSRIVAVCQDSDLLFFEGLREEIGRPKDVWLFRRPCVVGMTVEAMDKDDAVN